MGCGSPQVPEFCAEPVTSSAIGGWLRCWRTAARRIWISLGLSPLSSEKGDGKVLQQVRLGEDLTGSVATEVISKQQVQQGRKVLIGMLLAQQGQEMRLSLSPHSLSLSEAWSPGGGTSLSAGRQAIVGADTDGMACCLESQISGQEIKDKAWTGKAQAKFYIRTACSFVPKKPPQRLSLLHDPASD